MTNKKKPAEPVKTLPHIREELERENLKLFFISSIITIPLCNNFKPHEIKNVIFRYIFKLLYTSIKSVVITVKDAVTKLNKQYIHAANFSMFGFLYI